MRRGGMVEGEIEKDKKREMWMGCENGECERCNGPDWLTNIMRLVL